ncbi:MULTISPECIES: hypothetical protein [unclassified Mesorhizobium]|nr:MULTISPECIES: hypothetical protein [unclassified Mesorhizobium]
MIERHFVRLETETARPISADPALARRHAVRLPAISLICARGNNLTPMVI